MIKFISMSIVAAFFIFPYNAANAQKHDHNPQYETAYKLVDSQYKM